MADIPSHNGRGAPRDGQFNQMVVGLIRQIGPPKKIHPDPLADGCQSGQNLFSLHASQRTAGKKGFPRKNSLILIEQGFAKKRQVMPLQTPLKNFPMSRVTTPPLNDLSQNRPKSRPVSPDEEGSQCALSQIHCLWYIKKLTLFMRLCSEKSIESSFESSQDRYVSVR